MNFFLFFKYEQCWIYEHFPSVAFSIFADDYYERKPHACCSKSRKALLVSTYQKQLDRLTSDVVCWIPYGDHWAFREFELISLFFEHIDGVRLLSYTDQRGLWDNLVMCRPFLHTLLLHLYLQKMILMINGFSFLNTLHRWVKLVLLLDSVKQTTLSGSTSYLIPS